MSDHKLGNISCDSGWCDGGYTYPKPCEQDGCDGLLHADFGDENADGDYWISAECDKCGESA